MNRPRLTRRRILAGLVGAAAVGAAGTVAGDRARTGRSPQPTGVTPSSLEDALRVIGAAYLAGHPDDASPGRLRDLLDLGPEEPVEAEGLLRARSAVIRDELTDGAIETVDGWVLARTEVLVAALVAAS